MEKNIKKRVCKVVLIVAVVLVAVFVYGFFVSPNSSWQKRALEADEEVYNCRRVAWRKSEKMTMQRMLQDLTLLADGDSLMACWVTHINVSVYRDFIHGKAQPNRLSWAQTRYYYMNAVSGGREWMQRYVKDRKYKYLELVNTLRYDVQKDSTKDYLKEPITSTEVRYNKRYPDLGKSADKEFEEWREYHGKIK